MASNTTFGAMLREARERRGMDVQSIARQMRVRADIIRAIENNDFTRMPPRGYAKNMVATYARIVGVNQTTITRMYLEAANAYETGKMKNDSSRVPNMRSQRSSRGSSSRQADDSPRRSSGRLMFDDRRDTRGAARGNDHVHTSRRPLSPGSPQYTNLYAAPQNVTQQRPKLPLLIGIGVIAVIIIIVCVFVFGGKESKPTQETPTVPITGLSDTSNKQAQGDSESTLELRLPDPAVLRRADEGHLHLQGRVGFERLHRDLRGRFELGIRRRDGKGAGREVLRCHD